MSRSATSTRLFKSLQGQGLNHFPGQPVPMPDHSFSTEIFHSISHKPPLMQLEAIFSHPSAGYLGEETNTCLTAASFQVAAESKKVPPQPPPLQTKQPQLPQPHLIRLVLQTLHQPRCPSLDTLQPLNGLVGRGKSGVCGEQQHGRNKLKLVLLSGKGNSINFLKIVEIDRKSVVVLATESPLSCWVLTICPLHTELQEARLQASCRACVLQGGQAPVHGLGGEERPRPPSQASPLQRGTGLVCTGVQGHAPA